MATKATKAWVLPKFWISKRFYKKQPVKKNWGRIMNLAWLKFAVATLYNVGFNVQSENQIWNSIYV